MTTLKTTLTATAASLLALAATASAADMNMGNVKIDGYVVASYQYEKTQGVKSVDSLFNGAAFTGINSTPFSSAGDAARINFSSTAGAVSGKISLYYVPNNPFGNEFGILDAYVTWDAGSGWSLQAGKFYGPFGYEKFDSPSKVAITRGNAAASLIPANDNIGVQANYTDKEWAATLGLLDSLYNNSNVATIDDTDSELRDTKAIDASFTYTPASVKGLTLFAAAGWQGKSTNFALGNLSTKKATALYDLWASYQINDQVTAALEYVYSTNAPDYSGFFPVDSGKSASQWLGTVTYAVDKQFSTAFRVGRDQHVNGTSGNATQYTIAPAYKVSDNFTVRGELSHYSVSGAAKSANYFGLQGVFTF